jgi:hypothetical protein
VHAVELALEGRGVAGHRAERRDHGVHLGDEHAVGAAEAVDEVLHAELGEGEAARRLVGGLHRRARVDEDHDGPPLDEALGGARIAEREHERREERELEQERQQALQLREKARRLLVPEDAVPERRERHRDDAPAELEDVEDEDAEAHRAEDGEELRQRQTGEDHGRVLTGGTRRAGRRAE